MSHFPMYTELEFEKKYADLHLEVCNELGMGFVPNIFRCLANVNPKVALASWQMVKNNLCGGDLPRVSKEILFSYIAYRRNCQYCHVAHHAMALKFGHQEQDILEIIKDISSVRNPVLRSVLEFGEACLDREFNTTPIIFEKLKRYGFDQEEMSELIGMVSCALYMVNIASSLSVNVDEKFTDLTNRAA